MKAPHERFIRREKNSIVNNIFWRIIMKSRTFLLTLIVALMSITFLTTGCGNKKNYNNQQNILWGVVKLNQSGGEGTDDSPALNDDNPDTHIDQHGSNNGYSRIARETSSSHRSNSSACNKCGGKKGFFHKCKSNSHPGSSSKRKFPSAL